MNLQGKRKFGFLAFAFAAAALMTPAASAATPPCQTKNVRTGVEYKGPRALATAITSAASGDTITVSGTCFGNFALDKDLTLQGKGRAATVDGNQTGRVLHIRAGKTTIRDLAIKHGRIDGDGGGILIDAGASAELVDTTVEGNTAGSGSFGGGIEANGNLLLIRSEVTENSAGSSGGIDMNGPATVSLIGSRVTKNTATHVPGSPGDGCGFGGTLRFACGGGIWNFNGTLSLTDSTVSQNTAGYRGGGLRTSSTIQDGSVVSGITLLAGSTTIDANTAGDRGGGIFVRLGGTPEPPPVMQPTASLTFRVADGSPSYTDPLTGSTLPAWTGSVSGNTPDQCFPILTLGTHSCGSMFD
jgi:hypothetical protein